MKLNEKGFFVFLASMIIGLLVAMNINFGLASQSDVLSAREYQEALEEKKRLYNDIDYLQREYSENYSKLALYKSNKPTDIELIENIKKELSFNKRLLGVSEARGEGVSITLNDSTTSFEGTIEEDEFLQWAKIVHNTDVLEVVNSLRSAGAEAISINGQRIMSNSEVYCWGPFLRINGVNISAPFYISALGNSERLWQYLFSEDGYLTFLKYRGIYVSFERESNVKIPGYIGNYQYKFAKEIKNN